MSTTTTTTTIDRSVDYETANLRPHCPAWLGRFGLIQGPAAWRTAIAPALVEVLEAPSARSRQTLVRFAEQAIRRCAAQLQELDRHHAGLLLAAAEDIVGLRFDLSPDELVEIAAAAWDLNSHTDRVEE